MSQRTLVTGFLPFGRFAINPSGELARTCGRPFRLIEVSYPAVDEFLASEDFAAFDRILMLGVAGKSTRLRLERIARNAIGTKPDVRNLAPESRIIDAEGPDQLRATLWPSMDGLPELGEHVAHCHFSDDAGDYLCNYIFYRVAQRLVGQPQRAAFLHVVPQEAIDLDRQREILSHILEWIEQ